MTAGATEKTTGFVVDVRHLELKIAEIVDGLSPENTHMHLYWWVCCWFNDYLQSGDTWELLDELIRSFTDYEPSSWMYIQAYEKVEELRELLTKDFTRIIQPLLQNPDMDIMDMEMKDYRNGVFFIHSTRIQSV